MGSFRADEVDNYGGQGGTGYFSLKNDKDIARVRFLYERPEDLEGYAVHEVKIDGKKRYVNCLRSYKDPVDACPFCRDHHYQVAKLFIPLYNIDEDRIQIWERGKNFFAKMSSMMSRYPNFVSHVFEVERNGKPHDTGTTYEMYEISKDDTTLEDFDTPNILGGVVLDKSFEEMDYYLANDEFPGDGEEEPVRRRSSNSEDSRRSSRSSEAEVEERRTPQRNSSRRREF